MKRLNECTIDELIVLELAVSITYHDMKRLHPEADLPVLKMFAEDIKEAKRDQELENEMLPWLPIPSYNVVMVVEPLNDLP